MKNKKIVIAVFLALIASIVINIRITEAQLVGDVNGDDVVDINDVILASAAFGSTSGDPEWNADADINTDNVVDIFDIILIGQNFGQTT